MRSVWRDAGAANGMIAEAELTHRLGIEQISSIKNDRRNHSLLYQNKIDIREFAPFRGNNQRFGTIDRFESRSCEGNALDSFHPACLFHTFWIVCGDVRAFAQKIRHQLNRDRGANVVGVRFEREAPDGDFLFAQDPQRFSYDFEKTLFLRRINPLHFLEQVKRNTKLFAYQCAGPFQFRRRLFRHRRHSPHKWPKRH